jgi:nifR3 family TIM-barrel protein
VAVPVVLAPMAGITNAAFRQLCREQGAGEGVCSSRRDLADREPADPLAPLVETLAPRSASGLYVCEMITSRGIVERIPKTFDMLRFDPGESVRSVQLYGVDPAVMAKATEILCAEFGVHHVDLNFGCPVPKVTRRGGGGVLPWKRDRLSAILRATVAAADRYGVPVTMKTRLGIDADHLTYLDAGRIAQDAGCAAIALHARTVQQAYAGEAAWETIATLVDRLDIPVLGNGDIWEAADALAMVERTGCAGVVVGRGCLGRPWLFRDLADAFSGRATRTLPTLGEVAAMVRRHAELLAGLHGEKHGLTDLRKHMAWYFKGFPVGGELRRGLAMVSSFAELDALLAQLDPSAPFPAAELGAPRGRQGTPRDKVILPYGWLDSTELGDADLVGAESDASGG